MQLVRELVRDGGVTEQLQVALGSRLGQSLTAGVAGYCCPFDPLTEFTNGPVGLV